MSASLESVSRIEAAGWHPRLPEPPELRPRWTGFPLAFHPVYKHAIAGCCVAAVLLLCAGPYLRWAALLPAVLAIIAVGAAAREVYADTRSEIRRCELDLAPIRARCPDLLENVDARAVAAVLDDIVSANWHGVGHSTAVLPEIHDNRLYGKPRRYAAYNSKDYRRYIESVRQLVWIDNQLLQTSDAVQRANMNRESCAPWFDAWLLRNRGAVPLVSVMELLRQAAIDAEPERQKRRAEYDERQRQKLAEWERTKAMREEADAAGRRRARAEAARMADLRQDRDAELHARRYAEIQAARQRADTLRVQLEEQIDRLRAVAAEHRERGEVRQAEHLENRVADLEGTARGTGEIRTI